MIFAEKDVARTDRAHKYFAGDENPNLKALHAVLMTYCMYDFDLGEWTILSSIPIRLEKVSLESG